MKDIEVKKYQGSNKKEWDDFIINSKNGTFMFQRDFMDYHSHRFHDFSLMVYEDEVLIAVLPANVDGKTFISHQGLSYGGLVLGKEINFTQSFVAFKQVLQFLENENLSLLHLKLLPKIYNRLPSDEMDYILFLVQARLYRRDISSTIENAKALPIKSTNRLRGIRKGKKNQLVVKEETNFMDFWEQVLEPNLQKIHNQKPVHSVEEISKLSFLFPTNIKQFNVYYEERVVAGCTIFETSEVAHAQYISANEEGRKLGSLDMLFDHLLQIFAHKKYFDFGISNEEQGQKVNKGLLSWKESFGGRSVVHDFYSVETKNHRLLQNIFI